MTDLTVENVTQLLQNSQTCVIKTVNESTEKIIKKEVDKLKNYFDKAISSVENQCKDNKKSIQKNSTDICQLLKKDKRKNIIIYNFSTASNWKERETAVLELFQKTLQTSCTSKDIDFIVNLRKTQNSPILIGFSTWRMKMEILNNRAKLRGTNISLDEDYTPEVIQKRKELKVTMKKLKQEGHQKVVLRHATLFVDGKEWNENKQNANTGAGVHSDLTMSSNSPLVLSTPQRGKSSLMLPKNNSKKSPHLPKSAKKRNRDEHRGSTQISKATRLTQSLLDEYVASSPSSSDQYDENDDEKANENDDKKADENDDENDITLTQEIMSE